MRVAAGKEVLKADGVICSVGYQELLQCDITGITKECDFMWVQGEKVRNIEGGQYSQYYGYMRRVSFPSI